MGGGASREGYLEACLVLELILKDGRGVTEIGRDGNQRITRRPAVAARRQPESDKP